MAYAKKVLSICVHNSERSRYWLQAPYPENFVEISAADATRLGLKNGDAVKVLSASNPEGVLDLGPLGKKPVGAR